MTERERVQVYRLSDDIKPVHSDIIDDCCALHANRVILYLQNVAAASGHLFENDTFYPSSLPPMFRTMHRTERPCRRLLRFLRYRSGKTSLLDPPQTPLW